MDKHEEQTVQNVQQSKCQSRDDETSEQVNQLHIKFQDVQTLVTESETPPTSSIRSDAKHSRDERDIESKLTSRIKRSLANIATKY